MTPELVNIACASAAFVALVAILAACAIAVHHGHQGVDNPHRR